MGKRHFLCLTDLNSNELHDIIERAITGKQRLLKGKIQQTLKGKVLAMIFEKSSTRTRVSFETAMAHLGGHSIFLSPDDTQVGRGEPVEDTARVLSRMVDCIMIRTYEHEKLQRFADYSDVPVINGLSDTFHPCQLLADMQTYYEHRGSIKGKTVAWLGDGNNMCHSYINAASLFDFNLRIASPESYRPRTEILQSAGNHIELLTDPKAAIKNADLVVTDVWASMGQEAESELRKAIFRPYQVNAGLMALAKQDALFMHCLPAHRGDEVTADIIDGPQSVVWDEAGNRLHSQKALLEFLLK
ncbi:MAG: ornithine carbamoyltransferase [Gammaproteobacteria bacterium]|nr:ornithine carbamoyltransferase [Gammaproteobacteria bacterium]